MLLLLRQHCGQSILLSSLSVHFVRRDIESEEKRKGCWYTECPSSFPSMKSTSAIPDELTHSYFNFILRNILRLSLLSLNQERFTVLKSIPLNIKPLEISINRHSNQYPLDKSTTMAWTILMVHWICISFHFVLDILSHRCKFANFSLVHSLKFNVIQYFSF